MLPEEELTFLAETLFNLARLQNEMFSVIPTSYTGPTTITELVKIGQDEELTAAVEPYEMVIGFIRHSEEVNNRAELYTRITKTIGYATRVPLEQGWLHGRKGLCRMMA
jgi:hypothetical protein